MTEQDVMGQVAGRFGSMTEGGEVKPELFFATGGGTDSGPTLAHVTVEHAYGCGIKDTLYAGNSRSALLVNIDVCTHCGRLEIGEDNAADFHGVEYEEVGAIYGLAQESMFRDPRPCCGAMAGIKIGGFGGSLCQFGLSLLDSRYV